MASNGPLGTPDAGFEVKEACPPGLTAALKMDTALKNSTLTFLQRPNQRASESGRAAPSWTAQSASLAPSKVVRPMYQSLMRDRSTNELHGKYAYVTCGLSPAPLLSAGDAEGGVTATSNALQQQEQQRIEMQEQARMALKQSSSTVVSAAGKGKGRSSMPPLSPVKLSRKRGISIKFSMGRSGAVPKKRDIKLSLPRTTSSFAAAQKANANRGGKTRLLSHSRSSPEMSSGGERGKRGPPRRGRGMLPAVASASPPAVATPSRYDRRLKPAGGGR
jgi:hypothetical protein